MIEEFELSSSTAECRLGRSGTIARQKQFASTPAVQVARDF
jgi:hypothetical protein